MDLKVLTPNKVLILVLAVVLEDHTEDNENARQRYNELSSHREQFLNVAYECAELTIPTLLMRNEGDALYQSFQTPWQSVGAKGVTTLSSKLMLGLLPPSTSFFKLQVR